MNKTVQNFVENKNAKSIINTKNYKSRFSETENEYLCCKTPRHLATHHEFHTPKRVENCLFSLIH